MKTKREKTSTEHVIDFVQNCNNFTPKLKKILLFTLETLQKRDIWIECLRISEPEHVSIVLPLCSGMDSIGMQFHRGFGRLCVSCGPSTYSANRKEVLAYLEWLDKHMPRHGMTNRDIIEAGNPDNLHVAGLI